MNPLDRRDKIERMKLRLAEDTSRALTVDFGA